MSRWLCTVCQVVCVRVMLGGSPAALGVCPSHSQANTQYTALAFHSVVHFLVTFPLTAVVTGEGRGGEGEGRGRGGEGRGQS